MALLYAIDGRFICVLCPNGPLLGAFEGNRIDCKYYFGLFGQFGMLDYLNHGYRAVNSYLGKNIFAFLKIATWIFWYSVIVSKRHTISHFTDYSSTERGLISLYIKGFRCQNYFIFYDELTNWKPNKYIIFYIYFLIKFYL